MQNLFIPFNKSAIKTVIVTVATFLTINTAIAQSQNWWRTNGNTPASTDIFGTTNTQPINFTTNNTLKMVLDANGNLRLVNFAGTGNRVVLTDVNGKFVALAQGNANQFLAGDGTWKNLPVAATTFSNNGLNIYLPTTSMLGIGTAAPTVPLDVVGNTNISGTLKLSALSGTIASMVYVDALGNLSRQIPGGNLNTTCGTGVIPWLQGGNSVSSNVFDNEIGTCTLFDFVLKSGGFNRAWFQPDGTVSFGAKIVSNTNGPEYKFDQGAIRLSGNNSFGGSQIIFDNATANLSPYGDWGIEYTGGTSAPNAGLNFWKPFASTNANNNILFLADNNRIGMGTDVPSTRLTIDAWNDDGLLILTDPGKNVIDVKDKSNNAINFRVKSNGIVYSREMYVQISAFPDYVFAKNYKLPTLTEVKNYITQNHRLINMPSADDVKKEGANLGEIQRVTVEKLEEAYLYIFQLEAKLNKLSEKLNKLEQKQK